MFANDPLLELRPARDDDARALIALVEACWSEYPSIVLAVEAEVPELRAIDSHFRKLGGEFWVVARERRIVASVGWSPAAEPGGIELRKLYVSPSERRRGLGRALCELVETDARAQNAAFIDLWSDVLFRDAHRLYERMGFVRGAETRKLADLSGTVEYYYRKDLRAGSEPEQELLRL